MQKELKGHEENGTLSLDELLSRKHAIDSKWVYKIKDHLVAKRFIQLEGVYFHDTFAPIAKLVTIRSLLAVVVNKDWMMHQFDINNAFLHGNLDEEVYQNIHHGFSKEGEIRVFKLQKSLYGLRQAVRQLVSQIHYNFIKD